MSGKIFKKMIKQTKKRQKCSEKINNFNKNIKLDLE